MAQRMFRLRGIDVKVYVGDITEEVNEAIVVPANSLMFMGGAVKRKGGAETNSLGSIARPSMRPSEL